MSKYAPKSYVPMGMSEGYERWRHHFKGERDSPVYVHRLAAEAWFGLGSTKGNDVHHKNGIKWDTREDNIELKDPTEHRKHHAEERYGDGGWRDKELLNELYVNQRLTIREMCEELGCKNPTVLRWMNKYGIERRTIKESEWGNKPWRNKETMEEALEAHDTQRSAAEELGCCEETLSKWKTELLGGDN